MSGSFVKTQGTNNVKGEVPIGIVTALVIQSLYCELEEGV